MSNEERVAEVTCTEISFQARIFLINALYFSGLLPRQSPASEFGGIPNGKISTGIRNS